MTNRPCGRSMVIMYSYTSWLVLVQNMYSRVPACQISTFYYVGFAYMMMRRYQDAIRTFSNILLYIARTKQMFQNRINLYDQVSHSDAVASGQ